MCIFKLNFKIKKGIDMKRQLIITFVWEKQDDVTGDLFPVLDFETQEKLENVAKNRITKSIMQNFTSGEFENIVIDGVSYVGSWEMNTVNDPQ